MIGVVVGGEGGWGGEGGVWGGGMRGARGVVLVDIVPIDISFNQNKAGHVLALSLVFLLYRDI